MIVKISKGEKGIADYLKTGKKRDSTLYRPIQHGDSAG